MKNIKTQIQRTHKNLTQMSTENTTTTIKLLKTKDKDQIVKTPGEKDTLSKL